MTEDQKEIIELHRTTTASLLKALREAAQAKRSK